MTRFRIGLLILALLLAAGIWSQCRVSRIQEPIAQAMEDAAALALAGSWEAASQKTSAARKAWQESRVFTAAIADHGPMEDIEGLMAQLPALAAVHDRSAYAAACADLSRRIQAVAEAQQVNLGSLF